MTTIISTYVMGENDKDWKLELSSPYLEECCGVSHDRELLDTV